MEKRIGNCIRKTKETDIAITINLDGQGKNQIDTGIPFFDHMLNGFARHGLFDLDVKVVGDLEVDCHHTVEDKGVFNRYGSFMLPMDETLALCAIDLSGRPYLNFQAEFPTEHIGGLDTEMIKEFFYAVSYSAAMNLHLKIMDGGNSHHMAEALFKAFGKALDAATMEEPRMKDVWSTKGSL